MKTYCVQLSKISRAFLLAALAAQAAGVCAPTQGADFEEITSSAYTSTDRSWFNFPQGVAVDAEGNVYVADSYNNAIRKVTSAGSVTTLAGRPGSIGSNDGLGSSARFYYPQSIAIDAKSNLYVADGWNYTIRKITPAGLVTTLAGSSGRPGSADGIAQTAQFGYLSGIAVDLIGNVYVADVWNKSIRKVTPAGEVKTLAGNAGLVGSADGVGRAARFGYLSGVAVDHGGNVYAPDLWDKTIRKISPDGTVTTLAGTSGHAGKTDGTSRSAQFNNPLGISVDGDGNLYVSDEGAIRKLTPDGMVTTLAGNSGNQGNADGEGDEARFGNPVGVAVDSTGDIYVADSVNFAIRKVTSRGVVTTLVHGLGIPVAGGALFSTAPAGSPAEKKDSIRIGPPVEPPGISQEQAESASTTRLESGRQGKPDFPRVQVAPDRRSIQP